MREAQQWPSPPAQGRSEGSLLGGGPIAASKLLAVVGVLSPLSPLSFLDFFPPCPQCARPWPMLACGCYPKTQFLRSAATRVGGRPGPFGLVRGEVQLQPPTLQPPLSFPAGAEASPQGMGATLPTTLCSEVPRSFTPNRLSSPWRRRVGSGGAPSWHPHRLSHCLCFLNLGAAFSLV